MAKKQASKKSAAPARLTKQQAQAMSDAELDAALTPATETNLDRARRAWVAVRLALLRRLRSITGDSYSYLASLPSAVRVELLRDEHRRQEADVEAALPVAVDEEDEQILRALLDDRPRLMKQDDIQAYARVSRKTISQRTPTLLASGLVTRPKGKNGGITITADGEQILAKIDGRKGTQSLRHPTALDG